MIVSLLGFQTFVYFQSWFLLFYYKTLRTFNFFTLFYSAILASKTKETAHRLNFYSSLYLVSLEKIHFPKCFSEFSPLNQHIQSKIVFHIERKMMACLMEQFLQSTNEMKNHFLLFHFFQPKNAFQISRQK